MWKATGRLSMKNHHHHHHHQEALVESLSTFLVLTVKQLPKSNLLSFIPLSELSSLISLVATVRSLNLLSKFPLLSSFPLSALAVLLKDSWGTPHNHLSQCMWGLYSVLQSHSGLSFNTFAIAMVHSRAEQNATLDEKALPPWGHGCFTYCYSTSSASRCQNDWCLMLIQSSQVICWTVLQLPYLTVCTQPYGHWRLVLNRVALVWGRDRSSWAADRLSKQSNACTDDLWPTNQKMEKAALSHVSKDFARISWSVLIPRSLSAGKRFTRVNGFSICFTPSWRSGAYRMKRWKWVWRYQPMVVGLQDLFRMFFFRSSISPSNQLDHPTWW